MNNYSFAGARPSIDLTDVSSVKEMIFTRAREKSSSLAAEKEEVMTKSVQNDVMSEARASISSTRMKPFGGLTAGVKETESLTRKEQVEEPQLKHKIESIDNSVYTASMRDEAMNAARNQYSKKSSLTESLNFLNTQAAIKMVNKTHSKIV